MQPRIIEFLNKKIQDKNVLILGFGKEGQSTYHLLRKLFPQQIFTIADKNTQLIENHSFIKADLNLNFILGDNYTETINDFDLIFKTPGISFKNLLMVPEKVKISSQTEIFFELFAGQITGITGTKGKSTTSTLLYEVYKLDSSDTLLVGNIGNPPLDYLEEITENTRIVFELSAHQLEFVSKSPHISILLNLYQEHLDHFNSFESYQQAKFNIVRFQQLNDFFIYSGHDKLICNYLNNNTLNQEKISYSLEHETSDCYLKNKTLQFNVSGQHYEIPDFEGLLSIPGEHNLLNTMAVASASVISGISIDNIKRGIKSFKGLPHRLEFVGEYHGVRFYNDSIATIPEAAIYAVKALQNVDTLILGGFDRGIDYISIIEFLLESEIRNLILIGDVGNRINQSLKDNNCLINRYLVKDFNEVIKVAMNVTAKSKICLLSPAASSYDLFKNFEHRGDIYKKTIRDF